MAGYMAMARISGGRIRAIAGDRTIVDPEQTPALALAPVRRAAGLAAAPAPTPRERWASFREELGMMTFFLLDPESWR